MTWSKEALGMVPGLTADQQMSPLILGTKLGLRGRGQSLDADCTNTVDAQEGSEVLGSLPSVPQLRPSLPTYHVELPAGDTAMATLRANTQPKSSGYCASFGIQPGVACGIHGWTLQPEAPPGPCLSSAETPGCAVCAVLVKGLVREVAAAAD